MRIFENYTGNAMINNALMTIESLGEVKSLESVTPDLLLQIYEKRNLLKLNRRLKSYTMLFTKNGPLHNDKTNGEKVYDGLMRKIISDFENDGQKTCELTGLKFETTFDEIFKQLLKELEYPEKEIKKKDTTINRNWFPLIGGLGSDAQSLPQAKFTFQIHPICIAIMQFLPLSAFLYKGGVLLIDSSNFELTRKLINKQVKLLNERISTTKSSDSIENIKDFSKGNYLQSALEILDEFEDNEYADLNLWSFSNSGTGASCEIDRVPNALIKKLLKIKISSPYVGLELKNILSKNESAYSFLECLEGNNDWWLLYRNVFGSGKKAYEYDGCSIEFLEAYYSAIGRSVDFTNARHISYLIQKYKSPSFEKYLHKTDAWDAKEYRTDLFKVLCKAAENDEWGLERHVSILDYPDKLPVKNHFYKLHKLVHFYYQHTCFEPILEGNYHRSCKSLSLAKIIIRLIENDEKANSIKKDLASVQNYSSVNYNGLLIRNAQDIELNLILESLYNEDLKPQRFGLNELIHLYYLQKTQSYSHRVNGFNEWDIEIDNSSKEWINKIKCFSLDYKAYYLEKYQDVQSGVLPYKKLTRLILDIPSNTSQFLRWMDEAIGNTNKALDKNWDDSIFYSFSGEFSPSLFRFIFKFILLKELNKEVKF